MTAFSVTWDYRCPFARNVHEHLVEALRDKADWDVTFVPFSLGQVHVAEGEPDVWDRPTDDSGLLALQAGVVVRDSYPDKFFDAHLALFALRHDEGKHLQDEAEVRRVLTSSGVDADAVFAEIAVEVALELFVQQGYPATTISQIAQRSDTPEATLYRLFGSKRGVLKEVIDVSIGGDDEPIDFQDRPEVRAAFAEDDPGKLLDAFAHLVRQVLSRSAALQNVLLSSAGVDAEAAEMLAVTRRQRHTGQSRIVQALVRAGHLREGLNPKTGADILYALLSPEVFHILTVERGWSEARYERWVAADLRAQLLDG